jgi:hypothetical protein
LRRLIIVPSDRNETDNDLRRDPTPTSVPSGRQRLPKRGNAACAPRERQRFELVGRFPGCAYARASSEITGTLRASLAGQRRSRSHGIELFHRGRTQVFATRPRAPGTGLRQAPGELPCRVRGYRRRGCRAPCCSCLRLSRASFLRLLSFRQRRSTVNRVPLARP